jgi:hypothetical protein
VTAATLDAIDAAIKTQLDTLRAANTAGVSASTPFVHIGRCVIEGQAKATSLYAESLNNFPAALLAFEGERGEVELETLAGATEVVGLAQFAVLVFTADTREQTHALKGSTGITGVYALATKVRDTLNNLVIAGLYQSTRLRYESTRWFSAKPGEHYAIAVRFSAQAVVGEATLADTSVPLTEIRGDVNLVDEAGTELVAPFVSIKTSL